MIWGINFFIHLKFGFCLKADKYLYGAQITKRAVRMHYGKKKDVRWPSVRLATFFPPMAQNRWIAFRYKEWLPALLMSEGLAPLTPEPVDEKKILSIYKTVIMTHGMNSMKKQGYVLNRCIFIHKTDGSGMELYIMVWCLKNYWEENRAYPYIVWSYRDLE